MLFVTATNFCSSDHFIPPHKNRQLFTQVSLKRVSFSGETLLLSSCSTNLFFPQPNFRQSIDLYSSVPSPSITFLGTPTLSRLSSSFLSSSLTRRHTPEIFPSASKPLLPTLEDEQKPHQRRSSHSLLPPLPSRRGSARKSSKVSHELPISRQSSFGQAVVNGKIHGLMFNFLHILITSSRCQYRSRKSYLKFGCVPESTMLMSGYQRWGIIILIVMFF